MKLVRDSAFLIAVPAVIVIAGAWWIASGSRLDGPSPVRFALRDGDVDEAAAVGASSAGASALAAASESALHGPGIEPTVSTGADAKKEDKHASLWSGTVRSRDGTPIVGATVRVRVNKNQRLGDDCFLDEDQYLTLLTGEDGRVAFPWMPGYIYELEVCAPGFGLEKFGIEGQIGQDLTLDRASTLEGRVMSKDGRTPLEGATVVFDNANEHYVVQTDADGRFRFDGIGARAARLHISDNHVVATAHTVETLLPGQFLALNDFLLETGAVLSGSVVNGSMPGPVAGVQVSLLDRITAQVVSSTTSNAQGQFSFSSLNPLRQYIINATGTGFRFDSPAQFFGVGESVTLTVNPTWALGLVLRDETGAPEPGVRVQLKRQDGMPLGGGSNGVVGHSNDQGLLAFAGLSPTLAYRVVVSKTGYATLDIGPTTAAWNADQPLLIGLIPARSLSGVVIDEEGQPVAGVTVRAQRQDGVPAPPLFTVSNASGSFGFDNLAPGQISLVTFRAGYDNSRVVMEVAPDYEALVTLPIVLLNPVAPFQ